MSTIIKRVGYYDIRLDEEYCDEITIIDVCVFVIATALVFAWVVSLPWVVSLHNPTNTFIPSLTGSVLLGAMTWLAFAVVTRTFLKSWARINVWVVCLEYKERIYIKKTTGPGEIINDVDQKAICKAAQVLEEKAWVMENHRKELERIAGDCRK